MLKIGRIFPKKNSMKYIWQGDQLLLKNVFYKSFFSERFDQFSTLKNDFENPNFEMFEEFVHNFGKSGNDMI